MQYTSSCWRGRRFLIFECIEVYFGVGWKSTEYFLGRVLMGIDMQVSVCVVTFWHGVIQGTIRLSDIWYQQSKKSIGFSFHSEIKARKPDYRFFLHWIMPAVLKMYLTAGNERSTAPVNNRDTKAGSQDHIIWSKLRIFLIFSKHFSLILYQILSPTGIRSF